MFELNQEVKNILGRPNFMCRSIANVLIKKGWDIKEKAEDEQANVIYWMLTMYEKYGENWKEKAEEYLKSSERKEG